MHKLQTSKYIWGYLTERKGRAYRMHSRLSAKASAIDSWLFRDIALKVHNWATAPPA